MPKKIQHYKACKLELSLNEDGANVTITYCDDAAVTFGMLSVTYFLNIEVKEECGNLQSSCCWAAEYLLQLE